MGKGRCPFQTLFFRKMAVRNLLYPIQKRFLITSSSAVAVATLSPNFPLVPTRSSTFSSSSFTAQFLINSRGLSSKSALSVSKKLRVNKPHSVLQFFKAHHFSDNHIAKLMVRRPQFLHCRLEANLKPKFEYLVEIGFVGQLLPDLIVSNWTILVRSLDSQIKPSVEFLKSVLWSNDKVVAAIRRCSWLLTNDWKNIMQPNVELLIKEGVPFDRVAKLLLALPRTVLRKHDRVVYAVNALKNLGIQLEDTVFIRALGVMLGLSESTWKKKIELWKSFGWSEGEISRAFKRCPQIMQYSEKKITGAVDFFMNTMELQQQIIIACPEYIVYSIDKRVRPRYNVVKVLQSKKLIEGEMKIGSLITLSEAKFLENYVTRYVDQVPDLLQIYGGTDK